MKQKIIHLTTSLKVGGAESLICDILRHLKDDYNNEVIYFHDGPNVERIKKLGINTYKVKGLFCKYDPIFCIRLCVLIYKLKPNAILSHLWSANLLGSIIARICKIKIICVMHLASNVETKSKNGLLRSHLDKITFVGANKLIAVSDGVYTDLLKCVPAIKEKLTVIKNGIDYESILKTGMSKAKQRKDFNIQDNHFVIGCVGRFIPRKRHELLIESFAIAVKTHPNMRLFLLGSGPLENVLQAKVNALDISDKVIFAQSNCAYEFYPIFDVYVSTSQEEGLSIALLEAMSFALPCIVTNKTKKHEVITDNIDGFIITSGQDELQNLLQVLHDNFELRKVMGNASRQTVETKFCFNNMIDKYREILR